MYVSTQRPPPQHANRQLVQQRKYLEYIPEMAPYVVSVAISQFRKCGLQYSYTERLYTLGLNRNATIHNEPLNRQKGTE